jgi:predicted metal-dependent phosphoesterase TrpH
MKENAENLLRVELHVHTHASHDSLMDPDELLERCNELGIDRVAITDHDVIDTAFEMKAKYPARVIVGEEIQTSQGEIIGYFMTEWVKPGLSPMETIEQLRRQGAAISVPHPFDAMRKPNFTFEQLVEIAPYVDAFETFNARCISMQPNVQAEKFALEHHLLETVGSDAHSLWEVGRANLLMQGFSDAESFLSALRTAKKDVRKSPAAIHLTSRFAKLQKKLTEKPGEA